MYKVHVRLYTVPGENFGENTRESRSFSRESRTFFTRKFARSRLFLAFSPRILAREHDSRDQLSAN